MSEAVEQAAEWALRLTDGEVPEPVRRNFDDWLAADPANARAFAKAARVLGDTRLALLQDPEKTRRLLRRGRRAGTASALAGLAVLLVAIAGTFALDIPTRLKADIVSSHGQTVQFDLPDGSRVQLNADSAIAEHFSPAGRAVTLLKGEAFFEVRRDPDRPFTVRAGAGTVEVLGTAFDVNMISGDVEVTVTESRVRVTGDAGGETRLVRGDRVAYDDSGLLGPVRKMPEGFDASWRSGRLIFEDRPLDKVVQEIARHLPYTVLVAGTGFERRRVSGSFDLTRPVEAFASFQEVFGLRSVSVGDIVTVVY